MAYGKINEVAPRRPGGLAEQHYERHAPRDAITEKIKRMDWARLADRTEPMNLPPGVTLESLLNYFTSLRVVQQLDILEPGWDERLKGRY